MPQNNRNRSGKRKNRSGKRKKNIIGDLAGLAGGLVGLGDIGQGVGNLVGNALGLKASRKRRKNKRGMKTYRSGDNAPLAMSGISRTLPTGSIRMQGCEKIADLAVGEDTAAGTLISGLLMNANALGARFRAQADLWNNFVIHSAEFTLMGDNATTKNGGVVLAFDHDGTNTYNSGPNLPTRLRALNASAIGKVWENFGIGVTSNISKFVRTNPGRLTTDADVRDTTIGSLMVATNTDIIEESTMTLEVTWDASFMNPVVTNSLLDVPFPDTYTNNSVTDVAITAVTGTASPYTITLNPADFMEVFDPDPTIAGALVSNQPVAYIVSSDDGLPSNNQLTITVTSAGVASFPHFTSKKPTVGARVRFTEAVSWTLTTSEPRAYPEEEYRRYGKQVFSRSFSTNLLQEIGWDRHCHRLREMKNIERRRASELRDPSFELNKRLLECSQAMLDIKAQKLAFLKHNTYESLVET